MLASRVILLAVGIVLLAAGIAAADSPLAGEWRGQVTEVGVGDYTVSVSVSPDGRTGSVEYHRYPCGGHSHCIAARGSRLCTPKR